MVTFGIGLVGSGREEFVSDKAFPNDWINPLFGSTELAKEEVIITQIAIIKSLF